MARGRRRSRGGAPPAGNGTVGVQNPMALLGKFLRVGMPLTAVLMIACSSSGDRDLEDASVASVDGPAGDGAGTVALDADASVDSGAMDGGIPDIGAPRAPFRILFDAAHKNSVGNADWILDGMSPDPAPAHPISETEWSGGISAWGVGLHVSGRYEVRQLPAGTALAFGGGGSGDLRGFDAFVSDEPEAPFTTAEQAALMQFVEGGGGLFLVADHAGAQRCTTCVEAWRVINGFLVTGAAAGAFGISCDGNTIGRAGLTGSPSDAPVTTHFTSGHFGPAAGLSFHSGTSVSVTGSNALATVVVASAAGGLMASSSLPSGGRVVLLGDSSPTDDGTCTGCGARLYDGWGEVDNANFILNATAWLVHDGS